VPRQALNDARILIVDDQEANVQLLEHLLAVSDFTNVFSTTDSSRAVPMCAELEPDLLLLDLQMPAPDGFEVLGQLEPWIQSSARLPILVLTADPAPETKRRALSLGASDFLSKPLDMAEVTLRIKNLLLTRLLQLELRDQNKALEQSVRDRTRDLDEARSEVLERLAFAAEYRDDVTGAHAQRIGVLSALVAAELGLPAETVELIRRAAPLHDVGKIGISDAILLKKGQFTPEEHEVMKQHVSIGVEILGRSRSPLLRMAEEIALTHHERWDGSGYPSGLKAEEIPLSGRIVAVADVFDAITYRRRDAPSAEQALEEIQSLSGVHFDPKIIAALASLGLDVLRKAAGELDLVA
jgi:putative two-component system response regulator